MRIAVTYQDGNVFQHFGHTEKFKLYDVADNKVGETSLLGTAGSGHGALAGLLKEQKVDALICGGIGEGARNALKEVDIKLYGGVTGSADAAVSSLLAGTLVYSDEAKCSGHGEGHRHHGHHHHHHGEKCGHHHYGEAGCGHHHGKTHYAEGEQQE